MDAENLDRLKKMRLKSPVELKAAARHSLKGILAVVMGESAFRTDIVIFLVSAVVAFAIPRLSWCERALMVYAAFFPLVAELINTAIEKTIDRISLEYNALSGLAKDIGSALVFAAFVGEGLCWAIVLIGWWLRLEY